MLSVGSRTDHKIRIVSKWQMSTEMMLFLYKLLEISNEICCSNGFKLNIFRQIADVCKTVSQKYEHSFKIYPSFIISYVVICVTVYYSCRRLFVSLYLSCIPQHFHSINQWCFGYNNILVHDFIAWKIDKVIYRYINYIRNALDFCILFCITMPSNFSCDQLIVGNGT